MIDIHSHLLPGIDDGAADLEEAVRMCRLAANLGCSALIATPHQCHPVWWNTELAKLEILLDRVRSGAGDSPSLHLGGEIRVGKGFLKDLENFEDSGLASLAASDYLLLEFERRTLTVDPVEIARQVQRAGWRPIVAHPEFIGAVWEDPRLPRRLVDAGALLQVTAMSVTGDFGIEPKRLVDGLLSHDLVHFVASDCHGHRRRPPGLKSAFNEIKQRWGETRAIELTITNPRAVVENRPVEPHRIGNATV